MVVTEYISELYADRRHGDGQIIGRDHPLSQNPSNILDSEQRAVVLALSIIRERIDADFKSGEGDSSSDGFLAVIGAVQRLLATAYSNGCPHPEQAINSHLDSELPEKELTLDTLANLIDRGLAFDRHHSAIYQILLKQAEEAGNLQLVEVLKSKFEWQSAESDEAEHLPPRVTENEIGFGLANPELYEKVIMPLVAYINEHKLGTKISHASISITDLLYRMARECQSLSDLIVEVERFTQGTIPSRYPIVLAQ